MLDAVGAVARRSAKRLARCLCGTFFHSEDELLTLDLSASKMPKVPSQPPATLYTSATQGSGRIEDADARALFEAMVSLMPSPPFAALKIRCYERFFFCAVDVIFVRWVSLQPVGNTGAAAIARFVKVRTNDFTTALAVVRGRHLRI